MLKALDSSKNAQIAQPTLPRQAEYFCPGCNEPVILKAGHFKVAHFAHKPGGNCVFGAGESKEHMEVKRRLYDHLKTITHHVVVEQRIGNHIVDVYAKIDDRRFCFEVQLSPISPDEILDRMRTYSAIGAATVWVLKSAALDFRGNLDGEIIKIKRWWMFLQRLQLGVTCFVRDDEFIFCRLTEATSWVEEAHNQYGESVGGYDRFLKGSRTLSLCPERICFSELMPQKSNDDGVISYCIPYAKIWWRKTKNRRHYAESGQQEWE